MTQILFAVSAVTGIGLLCAVVLVAASHFMRVPTDERAQKIRECLPGANCGACGFAGCDQYAKALSENKDTKTNLCVPGGDVVSRQISEVLGVEFQDVVELVAQVRCQGSCAVTAPKMQYHGIATCAAANMMFSGDGTCEYGCLGYGDCAKACPSHAICVSDGVARVQSALCTGCGVCEGKCPKHLIARVPAVTRVVVSCSNADRGAVARTKCKKACIGCKKCEKACPSGAVRVENNHAVFDPTLCTGCRACVSACPVGCILPAEPVAPQNA